MTKPRAAVPLQQARLTDRQRVGVLLQASGLLSLLERAGWHLANGWEGACAAPAGLLALGEDGVQPGRSGHLVQALLSDLVGRLFGAEGAVAGRGQGRRAIRLLADGWQQGLVALPADEAVAQLLETAPFLWGPEFAAARTALWGRLPDGQSWIGGPAAFRWRLLGKEREVAAIADLLSGSAARELWPKSIGASSRGRAGGLSDGLAPPGGEELLDHASAMVSSGRFEAALAALAGNHSSAARALAARCQVLLGRLGAARATLGALEDMPLPLGSLVELAEVAARVYGNSGEPDRAEAWIDRALTETARSTGPEALRARLAAAAAAWGRRDGAAMERLLEEARPALGRPELAWRWHQASALRALLGSRQAAEVVGSLSRALACSRRSLARHEAAGLWNDLGLGRAEAGDLAGAERAFRHALRLYSACDGPRRTTLALTNLAEIRLRRGRLAGVWEILQRSVAENRAAGNVRALTQDLALQARHELTLGRAEAALALCREALAGLARQGLDWKADQLRQLAARALGWLGRPAEAAGELSLVAEPVTSELPSELDPEELPALWALAGHLEEALRAAAGTPLAPLWQALCRGDVPSAAAWEPLSELPPMRSARLVYDAELLLPGAAPPSRLRSAAATLRQLGATALCRRLEGRDRSSWEALAAYLNAANEDLEAVAELFAAEAGVSLTVRWDDGRERVVVAGEGGAEELSAAIPAGRLVLRAPSCDASLSALLRIAQRDLSRQAAVGIKDRVPANLADSEGLLGDAPLLQVALARADRLAPGELPILILGESGTGKELVARRIHRSSARSRRPFVAINCAALSETLLLSELFGHARGSFTGADREHQGVFETAHGGTVFLDEIGDLPQMAQGMLLRVLQDGEIRRVGEARARQVDVRILAATHRDLSGMVAAGSFRQDLYYRLHVGSVALPALAERGSDVLTLAHHFLAQSAAGGSPPRLSNEAVTVLLAHRWPGNVRELKNVLAVACALAEDGVIGSEHLDIPHGTSPTNLYHQQLDALRRRLVASALAEAGGRRAEAARRLGVSRQLLSYLTRRFKL